MVATDPHYAIGYRIWQLTTPWEASMEVALHTQLHAGSVEEYDRLHRTVPADLFAALAAARRARDWRIWRDGAHLFHVVDVDDYQAMRDRPSYPIAARCWWASALRLSPLPDAHVRQTDEGTSSSAIRWRKRLRRFHDYACACHIASRGVQLPDAARPAACAHVGRAARDSPDGFRSTPVPTHPGAFVATCHSGVTLVRRACASRSRRVMGGRPGECPPSTRDASATRSCSAH